MNILAIIVSYNPDNKILKLYNSIKEQVDELIIVDNFSFDKNSKKLLNELSKEVTVIYNDKNLGVAAAINQGAKYAVEKGYKWLLTLDQDSEFFPDTYKTLINSYEKQEDKDKVMIIAPSYREKTYNDKTDIQTFDGNEVFWKEDNFIITSGSLIKTECFKIVGFFEEKLFIDFIDYEFCLRLRKNGFKFKTAKKIFFIHSLGNKEENSRSYNYSYVRRYYIARNAVYVAKKYFFFKPFRMTALFIKRGLMIPVIFKVIFFEKDKLKKIFYSYKGFIEGFCL